MCGITGYISKQNKQFEKDVIQQMTQIIQHRGPDDWGVKILEYQDGQIALGHRRLSILDISSEGHQPMNYQSYWIVFNGEIYNFESIKKDLKDLGHTFRSNSDTEVILHAYKEWGVKAVERFIGMFAFSLYDLEKEKVYFFRDRSGVKPLYYYDDESIFIFGSELKSFHQNPAFKKEINLDALAQYFQYDFIQAPNCIFKNTKKLLPGHYLEYDLKKNSFERIQYWDILEYYKKPRLKVSFEEAKEYLSNLFKDAFNLRMVSDVPVGVFLSGGYDSSTVAAVLQKDNKEKLKTFTISFDDKKYDESEYAQKVANILGTDHHEYQCSYEDALNIIPDLPFYYDEPLADNSCIPTMLLSQKTSQHVTVALSADGGDEIFFGYNRHSKIYKYHGIMKKLGPLNKVLNVLAPLQQKVKKYAIYDKLFAQDFSNPNRNVRYLDLILQKYKSSFIKQFLNNKATILKSNFTDERYLGIPEFNRILAVDYTTYMADNILTKVDRATMAFSLEGREPLLDHRIAEYVAQLPIEYLYDKETKTKKYLLREICHDYLPKELMNRKKQGFNPPIKSWLRNELKDLTMDTLSKEELSKHNLLNQKIMDYALKSYMKGDDNYYNLVWNALLFQLWYKKWMN